SIQPERLAVGRVPADQDVVAHPADGSVRPQNAIFFLPRLGGAEAGQRLLPARAIFRVDRVAPALQAGHKETWWAPGEFLDDWREIAILPASGAVESCAPKAVRNRNQHAAQLGFRLFELCLGLVPFADIAGRNQGERLGLNVQARDSEV